MAHSNPNVAYYKGHKYSSVQHLEKIGKMHGAKRVVLFCTMTAVLPAILIITPLYLRHSVFADISFNVAESDVIAIKDGISSIFCNSHTLRMNSTFNAFQVSRTPTRSNKRKHIRLKKSMSLPDDTLEYWGFYLVKGSSVHLKACSRYDGSRILVVRGVRNLKTCGLLDHNLQKFGAHMDADYKKVKVTFETRAQEIVDSTLDIVKENKSSITDLNTAAEDESEVGDGNLVDKMKVQDKLVAEKLVNYDQNSGAGHNRRHAKKKFMLEKQRELYKLQESLNSNEKINIGVSRTKRDVTQLLDGGIEHGGNAFLNFTPNTEDESDVSSFENSLLTCYDGAILLQQEFQPSHLCESVKYLEQTEYMKAVHEVASDGYYYYIFYSDNDFLSNDIHAIFDIYKPSYQYNDISENFKCLNSTECTFSIPFWSDKSVIVEVPTCDGIEHEGDDFTLLISTCHPRMSVYMIFPIAVMFLILGCAFL